MNTNCSTCKFQGNRCYCPPDRKCTAYEKRESEIIIDETLRDFADYVSNYMDDPRYYMNGDLLIEEYKKYKESRR